MYLLKLALRPWRLAPFSQIFSAIAVGLLLFLTSFLFWLQDGLRPVLTRLQGEQVITAYLAKSLDHKDGTRIIDKITAQVGEPGIEIKLVNSSQFIQLLKNQYPDLARELEVL